MSVTTAVVVVLLGAPFCLIGSVVFWVAVIDTYDRWNTRRRVKK